MAVQSVDSYLREAAVLTVVLGAHTGLEVESLCQTGGLCDVENLAVYHVYEVGSHPALRLASVC